MGHSNISPFQETQTPAFLEFMSCHEDTLIASVAQFEMAMIRVRQGDETPYVVQWSAEPLQLLNSVATDTPMECEPPRASSKSSCRMMCRAGLRFADARA
jgi:hypothetical protein